MLPDVPGTFRSAGHVLPSAPYFSNGQEIANPPRCGPAGRDAHPGILPDAPGGPYEP